MHEAFGRWPARRGAVVSRRRLVMGAGAMMLPMRALAAGSRPPADRPDVKALSGDFDILQSAYERLHPGLLRDNTPAQIAAHFATLREALASLRESGPWLATAYIAFAKFAARIRCGHTYANFYNQSDAVRKALF